MKKLLLSLLATVFVFHAFGQIRDISECSDVTRRFISQFYSVEKQMEINKDPQKLSMLEYICAHSYEFEPGRTIFNSQKALFVVQRYEHMRENTYRVTIFDDYSGLTVILYSWQEINAEKIKIAASQLAENED